MNVRKIFQAFMFPVLPIVPECSYCAAMRFALIGSVLSGLGVGGVLGYALFGAFLGTIYGLILVVGLWLEYRRNVPPTSQ
jgi:hypothetical protein